MNLKDQIKLIPRNNVDYGFKELIGALAAVRDNSPQASNVEKIFQRNPLWTNSGRVSLYTILKSLELPPSAKIGVPLFCCPVVFDAIRQADLTPCFIDVNLNDFNLSVEYLREKLPELAAVVPVHMFGNPCDMDAIIDAAGTKPVIEDCAHSILSTYKGSLTGFLSTASFFSFQFGKYFSPGEGSIIFCQDLELQKKIERLIDSFEAWSSQELLINTLLTYAKATFYHRPWYGLIGYPIGMRLDKKLNLTAKDGFVTGKIASTHLALINDHIAQFQQKIIIQREHAYMLLNTVVPGKFTLPSENSCCYSNWWQFAIRFQNTNQRDVMAVYLLDKGIDTSKYLDDIVDVARSTYDYSDDCPNAELLSKTILLVPIHYSLKTSDIEYIARSINEGSRFI